MNFVAYVIELGVYMREEEVNPFIKENTGATAIKNDCKDFSLLYSKEFKSDFYLNVKCSKFAEQELALHDETKTLRPTGKLKHGISVVLDINTKPFFEKNKTFNKDLYECINNEAFGIINTKTVDLAYRMDNNLSNKYSHVDYGFMNLVQKFAKEQVELEQVCILNTKLYC